MKQHPCSSCNSGNATVEIHDLEQGAIVSSHYLCESCAKGSAPQPQQAIKLSSEIIENLLGGSTAVSGEAMSDLGSLACPGCGLTAGEFRLRGRLGCSRCYDVFRGALIPLLERVHDSTCHRGRFPGRTAATPAPAHTSLVELRNRLQTAIDEERYEDAAALRDELERAKRERDAE